ncbi:sensor histidine kinase [Lapillicoccus jejuensis]|uniref:sensor histidine kinase n=1 Tax=Lapillicoccus jejuensis TaxID=402171 RepID=UPI001476916A|nr:PAS domain S-box protein [Lapillicoccus jejuensis]
MDLTPRPGTTSSATPAAVEPPPDEPPGDGAHLDAVMRALVDVSPVAVVAVDGTGTVVFANPQAQALSGWGEDLLGLPVEVLVPDDRVERHRMLRDDYLEAPEFREFHHGAGLWWKRRDGGLVPVDISLTPVELAPGRSWTFAAATDVTERVRAQEQVLDLTRSYRMLAEVNQAILRSDGLGEVLQATCRVAVEEGGFLAAWLGRARPDGDTVVVDAIAGPARDLVGPVGTLVALGDRRLSGVTAAALRTGHSRAWAQVSGPAHEPLPTPVADLGVVDAVALPVREVDGELVVLTLYDGRADVFVPSLVRMLEQVAFNLALAVERFEDKARVERLAAHRRDLSARLLSAQEDERRRLAAELHDDPIQTLAATELRISMLRSRMTPGRESRPGDPAEPEKVLGMVDTVRDGIRAAITSLRDVLTGLEPPSLATSWEEAVCTTAGQVLETSMTRWSVVASPDGAALRRWDGARGAQALRIVQEALVNVRDHADAAQVEVRTHPVDGGVEVTVTDDGVGLPEEGVHPRRGHRGVQTMQDRAETMGGWCRLERVRTGGTRVRFFLPAVESG